jgi:N6-L-threonylcarbamoyladenine synthase
MRVIVALDTATEAIGLGIARIDDSGTTVLAGGYELAPRQANSQALPLLASRLDACGLQPSDIDVVVVGLGPGSFTGVRIGVAAAKGFAHGIGRPLAGVGTLDAIAWRSAAHEGLLGVVGDAMRSEVYPALFRCTDGRVERLGADRVTTPEAAVGEWAHTGEPILLTGNGLRKHARVFLDALGDSATLAPEEAWWPSGEGLVSAFLSLSDVAQAGDDPGVSLPVYTRLSDAEESERERQGLHRLDVPESGVAGGERR